MVTTRATAQLKFTLKSLSQQIDEASTQLILIKHLEDEQVAVHHDLERQLQDLQKQYSAIDSQIAQPGEQPDQFDTSFETTRELMGGRDGKGNLAGEYDRPTAESESILEQRNKILKRQKEMQDKQRFIFREQGMREKEKELLKEEIAVLEEEREEVERQLQGK